MRSAIAPPRKPAWAWLVLGLLLAAGCGDDSGDPLARYRKVENEYSDLFAKVYERLLNRSYIVDGDDLEDYGDSMAYCSALVFALDKMGKAGDNEVAFARNLMGGYERKVSEFVARPFSILADGDLAMEVYIGVLGMLAAYEARPEPHTLEVADDYFDAMTSLVDLFGPAIYAVPIPPYGPTTIKAGLASALLHYPLATRGVGRSEERTGEGLAILAEMDSTVWDERLGGYRYLAGGRHPYEYMYSNVTAIQALARAWRLTGDRAYLDRAKTVAEGLEALYSSQYGGYFASDESYPQAPHSGEAYIPLSAQNYTILVDLVLYQFTGEGKYLDRALRLFDFVERVLWVDQERICFHDIQHGQLADWYCTGCNWQLLYNLLLLDQVRAGIDIMPQAPVSSRHG